MDKFFWNAEVHAQNFCRQCCFKWLVGLVLCRYILIKHFWELLKIWSRMCLWPFLSKSKVRRRVKMIQLQLGRQIGLIFICLVIHPLFFSFKTFFPKFETRNTLNLDNTSAEWRSGVRVRVCKIDRVWEC